MAVARQIAAGVAAAHEAGILHRDLKSDNVLLLPEPRAGFRAVVTDFGLAGTIYGASADALHSKLPRLYGTVSYLAPERLAGGSASVASDVYALGVVMWELFSGRLAVASRNEPRGAGLAPSDPVTALTLACLERHPALRPDGAAEVLARLGSGDAPAPVTAAPGPATSRWWAAANRRRWVGALAVGVAALSFTLFKPLARHGERVGSPQLLSRTVTVHPAAMANVARAEAPALPAPIGQAPRLARARGQRGRGRTAPASEPRPSVPTIVAPDEPIRTLAPPPSRRVSNDGDAPISSLQD